MKAVYCSFRLPLFSSKVPAAYQIAVSSPLPLSSTLIGALARAVARIEQRCSGKTPDEAAKRCMEFLLRGLLEATSRLVGVNSVAGTKGTVILKRQRVLEGIKTIDPLRRSDALRREYVFSIEVQAIYLFQDDGLAKLALKAIPLIDRLGDTESLASPIMWGISDVKVVQDNAVDTIVRASLLKSVLSGSYSVIQAYLTPVLRNWPAKPKADLFLIPVSASTKMEGFTVLEPSTLEVALAEDALLIKTNTPMGPAKLVTPSEPRWV